MLFNNGLNGLCGLECGARGATGGALGEEFGTLCGEGCVGAWLLGKELGEDGDVFVGTLETNVAKRLALSP